MPGGVVFAAALFLVTGSVCLAGPVDSSNASTTYLLGFTGDQETLEEMIVREFLEQCPEDPTIEWEFVEAFYNLKKCFAWTVTLLSLEIQVPAFGSHALIRQKAHRFCMLANGIQPCFQDFLLAMQKCLPDYTVNDVISGYQEGVSIMCADDEKKLVAALRELSEEDEDCLSLIMSKSKDCEKASPEFGSRKHTIALCSYYACRKSALNSCGTPKKNFNEMYDDIRAAINRHVPCSSSHAFSPSRAFAAAAFLLALFANRFSRREPIF